WDASTNTLTLVFDGTLLMTFSDDIVANIFGGNANVFWGFTAGTGAANNNHRVCMSEVSFTEEGSFTVTSPSCPDFNNGAIDLDPAGGIPPFSYAWSNGADTEDITGLVAGTYTVTVTDGNYCQSYFTIELTDELDEEAPVITCPEDITVNNDPGQCGAKVYYHVTSTDGCVVNSLPGFTFIGTLGNSSYFVSNGEFTWLDALAHSRANGLHMATITSAAENDFVVNGLISNGLAGTSPWIGLSDADTEGVWKWITGETYGYSNWHFGEPNNAAGGTEHYANYYNISGNIRWNDLPNDLPPFWTPNPYVMELEGTQIFLQSGLYSGEVFPVGTTTVSYQAADAAGNTSECSFSVTVIDNENPVAVCQDVSVTLSGGSASITPQDVDGGSYDNCGIVSMTLSQSTFDCEDAGIIPVILTLADDAGNTATCTANVTVVGEVPVCEIEAVPGAGPYTGGPETTIYLGYGPQTVTLSGTASGGSAFTYAWSPSDGLSCSDCAAPVFTPDAEGNYTFTLTVTNEFGCTSTCSVTICVLDIRVPGTNGKKVYLCHVPEGNPDNPQTLSISVNAVPAHLSEHDDDHLGRCDQSCDDLKSGIISGDLITSPDGDFSAIIYPNPSTSDFRVSVETESAEPVSLKIYDLTGKVQYEINEFSPDQEITTGNDLGGGVYIMRIQQGNQVQNIRIIKQR
ncbi:MAG: T9SS type A sorting domain-containing protein, partial [Bacteroidales bacterium]